HGARRGRHRRGDARPGTPPRPAALPGRPDHHVRAAGGREDHPHPGDRRRPQGARPDHLAHLRDLPHPPPAGRRPGAGARGRLPARRRRRTRRHRPGRHPGGLGHRRGVGRGPGRGALRGPPGDHPGTAPRRHPRTALHRIRPPLGRSAAVGWTTVLLLAFDTATPAVTAAVCAAPDAGAPDSVTVAASTASVDARRHGELLAPGIADVVDRAGATLADLTHIAVGIGPGPYTGLRVGLVTGLSLADALGIDCVGVATLDALAFASGRTEPFIAATDARRKEVFWARYADAATRVGDIAVDRPAELDTGGLPVIGHGAALYGEVLGADEESAAPLYP